MPRIVVRTSIALLFGATLTCCTLDGPALAPGSSGSTATPVSTKTFEAQSSSTYLYQTNDVANRGKTFFYYSAAVSPTSFPLEVKVSKSYGASVGGFGVIFQRQDASNFWFVDIDVRGYYCVGQVVSGTINYVTSANSSYWVQGSSLATGYGNPNDLRIDFNGTNQYTFTANGTKLLDFIDSGTIPATGSFGFNVAVLSTEDFPDVPVTAQFQIVQPTNLVMPSLSTSLARTLGGQP
jgi:hypothetical protein